MKRAKVRRPDAITLPDVEIDVRCDHILGIMAAHLAQRSGVCSRARAAAGRPH